MNRKFIDTFFNNNLFDTTFYSSFNNYKYNKEDNSLIMEVPGYIKADLDVYIEEGNLIIKGEKDNFRSVYSKIPVNEDLIDVENTKAKVENGILTINFSKNKEPKNKRIQIE